MAVIDTETDEILLQAVGKLAMTVVLNDGQTQTEAIYIETMDRDLEAREITFTGSTVDGRGMKFTVEYFDLTEV